MPCAAVRWAAVSPAAAARLTRRTYLGGCVLFAVSSVLHIASSESSHSTDAPLFKAASVMLLPATALFQVGALVHAAAEVRAVHSDALDYPALYAQLLSTTCFLCGAALYWARDGSERSVASAVLWFAGSVFCALQTTLLLVVEARRAMHIHHMASSRRLGSAPSGAESGPGTGPGELPAPAPPLGVMSGWMWAVALGHLLLSPSMLAATALVVASLLFVAATAVRLTASYSLPTELALCVGSLLFIVAILVEEYTQGDERSLFHHRRHRATPSDPAVARLAHKYSQSDAQRRRPPVPATSARETRASV